MTSDLKHPAPSNRDNKHSKPQQAEPHYSKSRYRGRFAPSPTGLLHFGSLVTAVGSYLQAKSQQGEWLLRIDDIDPPREQKGAVQHILHTLEAFGFEWDGEVLYQSHNQQRYQDAVDQLRAQKLAYACSCSRAQIMQMNTQHDGKIVYPGTCRNGAQSTSTTHSIRLRCNEREIEFVDALQGRQATNLEKSSGDFVLQRRDGYFSYHLASGIDDAEQGITEVVRGADLLESTFCQLHVQNMLALNSPQYCHLPVVVNHKGQKLSKQSHAKPILPEKAIPLLYDALTFLGQTPTVDFLEATMTEAWQWACSHWKIKNIANKSTYQHK